MGVIRKAVEGLNGSAKPIGIGTIVGIITALVTFSAMVWAEGQRMGTIVERIDANQARLERHVNLASHPGMAERMARIEAKVDLLLEASRGKP